MNKECQGCYLMRIILDDSLFDPPKPEQISCQHEDSDCPCKTCLLKIICNPIEGGSCKEFTEFNVKQRKELKCQ
jgi:hypothetical protein